MSVAVLTVVNVLLVMVLGALAYVLVKRHGRKPENQEAPSIPVAVPVARDVESPPPVVIKTPEDEHVDRPDVAAELAQARLDLVEQQRALDRRIRELDRKSAELEDLAESLGRRGTEVDRTRTALDQEARRLEHEATRLDTRVSLIGQRADTLSAAEEAQRLRALELADQVKLADEELQRVGALSQAAARAEILTKVEALSRRDAAIIARDIEAEARRDGEAKARQIVVEAVQRVASDQTTESVVSVLHLPGDEMKGRIIGREGRNIRAFESITGVNVIIDDTPEAVLLSCFDPVRREVGRLTLEKLVADGRIHPQRIEDVFERSRAEIDQLCDNAARAALLDVGITGIDERLIPTIGRLRYRTSYGQNVLAHLTETAHVAGVMAAELGIEPALVKRAAFLHDIGKALTHEVEGSHAIVGAELLRRFGESEAVAHAVEAHHNEVQPRTIEAVLTQAADTCSAARPGARRDSLESYVQRLHRIEQIAQDKEGVDKVYAMQSGREVRVIVAPDEIDDLAAGVLAREIAKEIEDQLTYPGQIRVTVVRESRAIEIAH